jgi:hypothetical protein
VFAFRIDNDKGMIFLSVEGMLSLDEARRLNAEMKATIAEARRRFGAARIVADARNSPVQPTEVTACLEPPSKFLDGEGERYGVVVATSLSKLQVNRIIDDGRAKAFLSIDAAEDWVRGGPDVLVGGGSHDRA